MTVRFLLEGLKDGRYAYICFETELPFSPVDGQIIWELPGTEDWSQPFCCCEPVYLYSAQVMVVGEVDSEVDEEQLEKLLAAGWAWNDQPFDGSGRDA